MPKANRLGEVGVHLASELMAMSEERITVKVVLPLLFAASQELRRCVVLVMPRVTIDGEGNEVGARQGELAAQLRLRLEEGKAATRLNARRMAPFCVGDARKALARD